MRFNALRVQAEDNTEICDTPAPPGEFTVMGFWRLERTKRTPSRDASTGPLQEIKRELKRRTDSVAFRTVWSIRDAVRAHAMKVTLSLLYRFYHLSTGAIITSRPSLQLAQRSCVGGAQVSQ
jgi:hypothetical protein